MGPDRSRKDDERIACQIRKIDAPPPAQPMAFGQHGKHVYAKPALAAFYQKLDPCNCLNPGIGQTSRFAKYREAAD
ncbi:hypothetical protein [Paraburkholderia terrae]